MELMFPARQYFVRIGLVTDIPDQAVTGGVKYIMQCQREFNCTQTRRQMSAGSRDCVDQVVADLLGQLGQLCLLELA